jgi:ABC-type transporter Mla MlaB component
MVAANYRVVRLDAARLDYSMACVLSRRITAEQAPGLACIDLADSPEATMGALAQLIRLRGQLLGAGRDLRVTGLHGRTRGLYEIYRLGEVLPQM